MNGQKYEILDRYFDVNLFILKTGGVWVPEKSRPFSQKCLRYFYNSTLLLYCLCIYQPTETAVIFVGFDPMVFVRSLRDQFNHFICIYKIIRWFTKREEILQIMEILQSKEFIYEELGNFRPWSIIEGHKRRADRWAKLFLYGVNGICVCMFISVFFVLFFQYTDKYREDENGNLVYAQKLPVTLLTPFEKGTRLSFALHFLFEILPLDIYGWIIIGLDTLFTSIMSCISAHLCILQGAFKTIRPRCLRRLGLPIDEMLHNPKGVDAEMLKEMNKCVRHLQVLISVSERLENVYNRQTCGQVVVSLFEMCFCLYLLSRSFNESFGNEFAYLFSTAFELLLYCWFGNQVTEASAAIPEALFESDWLSSDVAFKKNMLITMTRMRKPIHLTIAKFTPLAFTTFLSITRVAYSFFTVLRSGLME